MSTEPEQPPARTAETPFSEPPKGAEPTWIGRDPVTKQFLPGFPGPRYSGKATSTIARAEKLVQASQPLIERRDTILRGGPEARIELARMLVNSIVAIDHFEREIGARLVLDGPLTGKGYSKAALTTASNLATTKTRLIDKALPLLGIGSEDTAPRTAPPVSLEHLTTEELAAITEILDNAKTRTEAPAETDEPSTEPPVQHIRIEVLE